MGLTLEPSLKVWMDVLTVAFANNIALRLNMENLQEDVQRKEASLSAVFLGIE